MELTGLPGWILDLLLAAVPLAAAAAVTLHVLLRKREITTAAAWIALAWLSPYFGSVLYYIFGINRVMRRALKLRRSGRRLRSSAAGTSRTPLNAPLQRLNQAGWRITGRNSEAAEIVTVGRGETAYPKMLAAIAGARRSIALASYIFRADAVGEQFIAALIAAQQRGVAVRVLIDSIGGGYLWPAAYRRLRRAGIPVARFLHSALPWRMSFINLRSHKKLLILDGERCFVGGLNIGCENLPSAPPRDAVRDTHFHVGGPVVAQLMENFAEDWWFTTGEILIGPDWLREQSLDSPTLARAVSSGPDQDLGKLELTILSAVTIARRSIRIATPYFLPDGTVCSALTLAAMRGVAVDVVIPLRSDHIFLDWAMRAHVRPLIEAGCTVWRRAPPFDHSKLMSIDDEWALIGSANWDVRSLRLNFELDLEVYDERFAREVSAMITDGKHERLTLAKLDAGGLPLRLRDAAARLMLPYL